MKYAIFGAGAKGLRALDEIGETSVSCFIDNSCHKQGMLLAGKTIVDWETFLSDYHEDKIVIATVYASEIIEQLKQSNVSNYEIYFEGNSYYYPPDKLVINPYESNTERITEEEYVKETKLQVANRRYVNLCVDEISKSERLFDRVEIETYNRCNGGCDFCPINSAIDPRPETRMSAELFYKIINELSDIEYNGKLCLFSNNEPFLDDRILEFQKYARKKIPKARLHLFTNATKLSIDLFKEIVEYLDELIIDNYNQQLELIPTVKRIKEYCENHPELIRKVTIVLRKPHEILTTRGGDAPNRAKMISYGEDKCILPFRQMVIRPDGKVSLCCNDPLGKNTLGDVSNKSLVEVWYNDRFAMVRKCLLEGRKNWKHCEYCDVFSVG